MKKASVSLFLDGKITLLEIDAEDVNLKSDLKGWIILKTNGVARLRGSKILVTEITSLQEG